MAGLSSRALAQWTVTILNPQEQSVSQLNAEDATAQVNEKERPDASEPGRM